MATEKNEYGFRIDSKPAQICGMGKEWFESATNQTIMDLLDVNAGYASNLRKLVAEATGWLLNGAKVERTERKTGNVKIKGCLPRKVMYRIAKILDIDLEESDEPSWQEFLTVCELDPDFEGFSMVRLAGGPDSEGGKDYQSWIDSNRANDRAIAEKALRDSDPTIQLKDKLVAANKRIAALESELAEAVAAKVAAESRSGRRGPVMGGELNNDMLRIMKQRFHPDKNNGSPELCEAVMKWLNAIVL